MASTGEAWRLGRRPELDGLRGIAVLLVLACHLSLVKTFEFAAAGPVGVTIFFTLSGFLITALLLEEHQRTGLIRLGAFYRRRARRLFPALASVVVTVGLLALVFGGSFAKPRDLVAVSLYVGNWLPAGGEYLGALNHTWSLAIEEQFYLVWPVVVIATLRWLTERYLAVIALFGAAASTVARLTLWDASAGADRVYFGSDTRADALLIGCALAVALRRLPIAQTRPRRAGAILVALCSLGWVYAEFGWERYLILPTLTAVGTSAVIAMVVRGDYRGWLSHPSLRWFGERSYGLYLWHVVVLALVQQLHLHWLVTVGVALAASLAVTELSWRCIEAPFRVRRTGQAAVPAAPPAYAGT